MKMLRLSAVYLVLLGALRAGPEALLVPPTETAHAGKILHLTLFLNNPTTESSDFVLPNAMQATLVSTREQRAVSVVPDAMPAGEKIPLA